MTIKHKIVINVSDPNGRKAYVLRGADVKLPARLLKFLFGDFTQVYLLSPRQTVESVDIREVEEEGKTCQRSQRMLVSAARTWSASQRA
ncbi:MAG TPA: hypothetical protein DCX23_02260 [Lachnospiraceae bacterium]|nr:hypothetical protein [Lachnospiraceae bacterium]